jgi:hypothetical protein
LFEALLWEAHISTMVPFLTSPLEAAQHSCMGRRGVRDGEGKSA